MSSGVGNTVVRDGGPIHQGRCHEGEPSHHVVRAIVAYDTSEAVWGRYVVRWRLGWFNIVAKKAEKKRR